MLSDFEPFDAVELILKKRHGQKLHDAEIFWIVDAFVRGAIVPEQMSALLMAIVFQGMTRQETVELTRAMIASGKTMSFKGLGRPTVDKHSTGGVGDKITLPLVPLVASFGVAVPQLSGRGLGHTGGTLDKLESIPGWRADLTNQEIFEQLKNVGGVICAAGDELAPADKKIYALRDVTGTVASIPLIASSIMSKKIAEGTGGLVLDVKFGSGAFMKDFDTAKELAQTMVDLGHDGGLKTTALLTDMNTPLGVAVGNANEVNETLQVLAGGGPADVVELTVALAREMLELAGVKDADPAAALKSGKAMDAWNAMLAAQGAEPVDELVTAGENETITAEEDGYVSDVDAYGVGIAAWRLGAGRSHPGGSIDHAAGVDVLVKPGDAVKKGDPLLKLYCDDSNRMRRGVEAASGTVTLAKVKPEVRANIVREKITAF